jgi:hypothetical protein
MDISENSNRARVEIEHWPLQRENPLKFSADRASCGILACCEKLSRLHNSATLIKNPRNAWQGSPRSSSFSQVCLLPLAWPALVGNVYVSQEVAISSRD